MITPLYTYGTVGHNALLVDGEGQNSAEGKIDRFETAEGFDYLRGDAPAGGWFVLWDDIAAASSASSSKVAFLLQTDSTGVFLLDGKPAEEGKMVNATEVTIERERGRLTVDFLGSMEVTPRTYPDSEGYGHYVSVTHAGAAHAGFVALLWVSPKDRTIRPEKSGILGNVEDGTFGVEWSAGGKAYRMLIDRETGKVAREQ